MREEYFDYMDQMRNPEEQKMREERYLYMKYKQKRNRTIIALISSIIGVLIYFYFSFIFKYENIIPKIIGLSLSVIGIAVYLINYLQNDYSIGSDNNRNVNYRLKLELEELRLDLQKLKKKGGILNDNTDINETINNIINNTFTEEFIQNKIEKTFANNAIKNERYNNLFREFDRTSLRINEELLRLRKSANINLVIGSLFTTVVILALTYEVFFSEINFEKMVDLLSHYIPRISLVIFVEIFAFFFLKLYKSNLQEIKYFNNEKTNVDFKLITLKTALFQEDLEMIKICLSELIKTERNFILKKDESTVEIEKIKHDNANNKILADLIEKVVAKK
ncbi:MAG: hypothetical protein V4511_07440 [Bacteroidota bacterium]